ncbi:type II toxin-antitoxin system VapC family toxin [Candidatus Microgenomates bacterium]|nr:type II toxin-antitoxin system VapC family toxin [Candidatus Microgenomates bacterium]
MIKSIVIDASVVAKWLLPDEKDHPAASRIKEEFISKTLGVAVPVFIFYEINNLLKSATKGRRINPKKSIEAYEGFLNLDFKVYSSKDLLKTTLEKALELDISSYDASYIVLAEYLEVPLYTADEKLIKKAQSKWIKDLKDY